MLSNNFGTGFSFYLLDLIQYVPCLVIYSVIQLSEFQPDPEPAVVKKYIRGLDLRSEASYALALIG